MKLEKGFHEDENLLYYYSRENNLANAHFASIASLSLIRTIIYRRYLIYFLSKNILYKYIFN